MIYALHHAGGDGQSIWQCGGEGKCIKVFYAETGTDHLENSGVDDRIVLKWIPNKSVGGRTGLHLFGSGLGQLVGCSEQDNLLMDCIKCWAVID